MNLNDKRSKKIAEVMGNKTSKKIIDYLSYNSEKSEEDIAKALDMKINTVEYNLKKLLDSGLVEKSKKFFWSKKGKKIPLYKLAKKHIVISPKNSRPNFAGLKTIIPVIIALALVVASIAVLIPKKNQNENFVVKKFESMDELEAFLSENSGDVYGAYADVGGAETSGIMAAGSSAQESDESADDYSTTNVQVEGVDEADIVKNDGKYIYVLSGNTLSIIDAYPAESMKILAEFNVTGAVDLFLNDDKLIIFSNNYENALMNVYDVSDKGGPELVKEISYKGYYVDSRMIGDYVYLVSNNYVSVQNPELPIFKVDRGEASIRAEDISYFPYPDTNYVFTNVLALDLGDFSYNSETFLVGASHNVYVSEDNIYLTGIKRISQSEYFADVVEDVFIPILPNDVGSDVKEILNSDDSFYEKQSEIGDLIMDFSESLGGAEKAEFESELEKRISDYVQDMQKQVVKTIVHKISIDGLSIEYKANGLVPGSVLNQFSMDEHEGFFRIATTTGNSWGSSASSLNHMYVLNENLKIVGSVDDLAEGERIYSVRFMGERAYMVTFRQVDPLFVVDLSNPENPEVLGQLKVTGYSSYLHPYDENHIIGIGKEATEEGRVQGLKIAVFDISDVENPIENAKYEIEGRWSDSNALYDHKAFLFDGDKNLLVIPVSYTAEAPFIVDGPEFDYFQGAFVFYIDENEISLKGKINHEENDERGYYYGPYAVQRSLFMDNVLYTISRALVKANYLETLNEIGNVSLPYTNYVYYAEEGVFVE